MSVSKSFGGLRRVWCAAVWLGGAALLGTAGEGHAQDSGRLLATSGAMQLEGSAGGLATMAQRGRRFTVPGVPIARSDTARFVNEGTFPHQVFVQSPDFSYGPIEHEPGQTVDVRFTSVGGFTVRCHIHPKVALQVDAR